jgi:hypothetical protein
LKLQVDLEYSRDARKAASRRFADTFEPQPATVVRDDSQHLRCPVSESARPRRVSRGRRAAAGIPTIAERVRVLDPLRERLLSFQARLSDPAILSQLLQSLEESEALPEDEDIGQVLGELHVEGLETMLTFLPTLKRAGIRRILEASIDRWLLRPAGGRRYWSRLTHRPGRCGCALWATAPQSWFRRWTVCRAFQSGVRREAVVALGSIAFPALTALERALDDRDHACGWPRSRSWWTKAIAQRSGAGGGAPVTARAERRSVAVLRSLCRAGEAPRCLRRSPSLSPGSCSAGDAGVQRNRICAAYALARLQTPRRAPCRAIQLDKDLPVRNAAIRALRSGA